MTAPLPARPAALVIGPMPPPVTGYSIITESMIARLKQAGAVETVDTSANSLVRGSRYHVQRFFRVLRALWALASRAPRRDRILYLALAGGAGVIYDLALVSAARLLAYRVFIHHHAFAYIDRRSHFTATLVAVAGQSTMHICLCPTMARRLRERYPRARRITVLSNAAFIGPSGAARSPTMGPTRIGFLSNLTPEKGLDTAIEVFRSLRTAQQDFVLIIAGPAPNPPAQALLEAARREFGAALDYRGPVYGADKAAFFRDLDVFLFPTRYSNEAEPLVVLEALAAGVPVIATPRGCIPDDLTSGGSISSGGSDFAATAAALIMEWSSDRSRMAEISAAALGRATVLHRAALGDLDALVSAIMPPAPAQGRSEAAP